MQSDFQEFSMNKVASEATMYLKSEPALLDRFISDLRAIDAKTAEEATLETI